MEKANERQSDLTGAIPLRLRKGNVVSEVLWLLREHVQGMEGRSSSILGALERIIEEGAAESSANETPSFRVPVSGGWGVKKLLGDSDRLQRKLQEVEARTATLEKQNAALKQQLRARELELELQKQRQEERDNLGRRQLSVLETQHARLKQSLCDSSEQLDVERTKRRDLEEALEDVERAHRAAVQQQELLRAERDRAQKNLQEFVLQAGGIGTKTGTVGTVKLLVERNRVLENQLQLLETEVSIYRKLDERVHGGEIETERGREASTRHAETTDCTPRPLTNETQRRDFKERSDQREYRKEEGAQEEDKGEKEEQEEVKEQEEGGAYKGASTEEGPNILQVTQNQLSGERMSRHCEGKDEDGIRLPSPVKSEASGTVSMDDESKIFF